MHVRTLVVLASLLASAHALGEATAVYSAEVLASPFPSEASMPVGNGLNNDGVAVGFGIESGWFQGLHWPEPGTVIDYVATYGLEHSFVYDVADDGTIVGAGTATPSVDKESAFVQAAGEAPVFLAQLVEDPGIRSNATAIAPNGLIAGDCDTVPTVGLQGDPMTRAVLWEDGVPTNLGTLGGNLSTATGVNADGVVVGVSNDALAPLVHAFRWTAETGMLELPGLQPGARTIAADINAAGVAAGDADQGADRFAVVWPDAATVEVLPEFPGDLYAEASAINDFGQVVGRGATAASFEGRLWQGAGVYSVNALTDAPGFDLFGLVAINERGQMLALAFDTSGPELLPRTLLLTPNLVWEDLGSALAGAGGEPSLATYGNLLGGGPVTLEIGDAVPGGTAFLVVGLSALDAPFKGGTLVPSPAAPGFSVALPLDGSGARSVAGTWPEGVPAGVEILFQAWIPDAGGPKGFAATNAVRGTTP